MDRQTANELRMRSFGDTPLIAFVCECADESCRRTVTLSPAEYHAIRAAGQAVLLAGHMAVEEMPARAEGGWTPRYEAESGDRGREPEQAGRHPRAGDSGLSGL
jgi:hypothetical protein